MGCSGRTSTASPLVLSVSVPRVVRVQRSPVDVVADGETSALFSLDDLIVAGLAGRLVIRRVAEQLPCAFVRYAVIDRRRPNSNALSKMTFAQWLSRKLLLSQSARSSPDG